MRFGSLLCASDSLEEPKKKWDHHPQGFGANIIFKSEWILPWVNVKSEFNTHTHTKFKGHFSESMFPFTFHTKKITEKTSTGGRAKVVILWRFHSPKTITNIRVMGLKGSCTQAHKHHFKAGGWLHDESTISFIPFFVGCLVHPPENRRTWALHTIVKVTSFKDSAENLRRFFPQKKKIEKQHLTKKQNDTKQFKTNINQNYINI